MSKALVIMLELYVQRTAAEDVMPSAEAASESTPMALNDLGA